MRLHAPAGHVTLLTFSHSQQGTESAALSLGEAHSRRQFLMIFDCCARFNSGCRSACCTDIAALTAAGYELENADKRDESRIKPLYKKFSMWHGISSSLNLVATVGAVAHGWWLAGRMVAPVV